MLFPPPLPQTKKKIYNIIFPSWHNWIRNGNQESQCLWPSGSAYLDSIKKNTGSSSIAAIKWCAITSLSNWKFYITLEFQKVIKIKPFFLKEMSVSENTKYDRINWIINYQI